MAEFMVLIRGCDDVYDAMSPEEVQAAVQQYIDWDSQLRQQGRFVASNKLISGGAVVRNGQGQLVVDGPYAETKEAIGGYYVFEASDLNEACEIARGCPVLGHGGFVEVRGVVDHSS